MMDALKERLAHWGGLSQIVLSVEQFGSLSDFVGPEAADLKLARNHRGRFFDQPLGVIHRRFRAGLCQLIRRLLLAKNGFSHLYSLVSR